MKRVLIKLGNKCNHSCSYCHASKNKEFGFNRDILAFLKNMELGKVGFGGGEPLMYFDKIKEIVEYLDNISIFYKFTTNGSLLTEDIVRFLNVHGFAVGISYDGTDTGREYPDDSKIELYAAIKKKGISSVFFKRNSPLIELAQEFYDFTHKTSILNTAYYPAFIHQTAINPNMELVDTDTIHKYIEHMNFVNELQIKRFLYNPDAASRSIMMRIGERYNKNLYKKGFECCNENNMMMTASGDFMLCPYGSTKVGDIYKGIDWDLVESFKPQRCRECELFEMCGNTCISNITENECYIYRKTYEHFLKICDKYGIVPQELKQQIKAAYIEK